MKANNIGALTAVIWFFASVSTYADITQVKIYKEAFPDEKPKCAFCHIDALPKKDAGKHDLNEYGLKVKEANANPTADDYKKLGSAAAEEN